MESRMKTLVITGGSKGIGKATAALFATHGYQVINIARSASGLPDVHDLALDLASSDLDAQIHAELLPLIKPSEALVLIHNAAQLRSGSLQTTSGDELRQILDLNVTAPQRLNQQLLPLMSTGSAILYVGSTLSEKAVANSFSYVTSKHAMLGMMRATCQDLIGTGIHTACICPGFTDTEMLRAHVGDNPEVLEAIANGNGFGRLVSPGEMASLLFYTAENPVINGSVLHGNLGQIES